MHLLLFVIEKLVQVFCLFFLVVAAIGANNRDLIVKTAIKDAHHDIAALDCPLVLGTSGAAFSRSYKKISCGKQAVDYILPRVAKTVCSAGGGDRDLRI